MPYSVVTSHFQDDPNIPRSIIPNTETGASQEALANLMTSHHLPMTSPGHAMTSSTKSPEQMMMLMMSPDGSYKSSITPTQQQQIAEYLNNTTGN